MRRLSRAPMSHAVLQRLRDHGRQVVDSATFEITYLLSKELHICVTFDGGRAHMLVVQHPLGVRYSEPIEHWDALPGWALTEVAKLRNMIECWEKGEADLMTAQEWDATHVPSDWLGASYYDRFDKDE